MRHLLSIGWFLLATSFLSGGELAIHTDFSGGSAEVEDIDQERRLLRIKPTPHKNRGWICWWHFRCEGITPGGTITAFSLDGETWRQTPPGKRRGKRIVYKIKVDAKTCWFAWGPPFSVEDAEQLVKNVAKKSPHARAFELCKTRAGRSVPGLIVKEANGSDGPRWGIWIQARQHAWEAGSSWVCKGFAEWLISEDPQAEVLRKHAVVTIIPVMDVDNVAIGAGGKNQKPQDHNRDWSDDPHWQSVRAAQSRIRDMDRMGRFDLFVDLHNPGANDTNPYFYIPPRDRLSAVGRNNLNRFLACAKLEITGPLTFQGNARESGANYDRNWKKISKNWVSENTRERVVAVTLETAWNTANSHTDGYQTVGRQLGQAIERYFRTAD